MKQRIKDALARGAAFDAENITVEIAGDGAILRGRVRSYAEGAMPSGPPATRPTSAELRTSSRSTRAYTSQCDERCREGVPAE